MADYIKREAAATYAPLPKELREYQTYNLDDAFEYGYDFAIQQIDAVPAADVVEVRRGRWVDGNGNPVEWDPVNKSCPKSSCYCSVCGEWLTASDEYPSIGNFCPNCGARNIP